MPTFTDLAQVTDFKTYKALMKTALGRLRPGTGANFVYVDKFKFGDKERSLVLIDHDAALQTKLKVTASGKCKVDDDDRFVFAASKGTVNFDKVQRLFTDVGVPRAVANPDDAPSDAREPIVEKLDMKYGWTEMRTWGDEAAELIEKFDGLVGLYKSIPDIKPEWTKLQERYDDVKDAMAGLVKSRIENNPKARGDHQRLVEAQTDVVQTLIVDIRKQATAASQPRPSSSSDTAKQVSKPVVTPTPTPTSSSTVDAPKQTPQPVVKPPLSTDEIKRRVRTTLPVGGKDDAARYAARMRRALEAEFSGVSDDHIKAIELLADKAYFASAEESTSTTPSASTTTAPPTLTATQAAAIDRAMQAAQAAANGPAEMLDNDAQVALGDAITAAVGGNYPTHSRGGGHKGSFTKDKSIQQQLSNIGKILNKGAREAINAHLDVHWNGYNV